MARLVPSKIRRYVTSRKAERRRFESFSLSVWDSLVPLVSKYDAADIDSWKASYEARCKEVEQHPLTISGLRPRVTRACAFFAAGPPILLTFVLLGQLGGVLTGEDYLVIVLFGFIGSVYLTDLAKHMSAPRIVAFLLVVLPVSLTLSYVVMIIFDTITNAPGDFFGLFADVLLNMAIGGGAAAIYTIVYRGLLKILPHLSRPSASHEKYAIVLALSILYRLRVETPDPLLLRDRRISIMAGLRLLASAVEHGISGHMPGVFELDQRVTSRFSGAAAWIRELEIWVALPQRTTLEDMRDSLHEILGPIVTGRLHYLPSVDPSPATSSTSIDWRRVVFNVIAGAVPAALLALASILGLVPEAWREAASAIAVLSVVIGVANAFRPGAQATLQDASGLATSLEGLRRP
jgi:hypothetical protein